MDGVNIGTAQSVFATTRNFVPTEKGKPMAKLIRYRFKTRAVDDYRPLVDMKDIKMPWWCTGFAADESYAIIVCYLPDGEALAKYWDDAYDITMELTEEIKYTSRFPKPRWLEE